MCGEITSNENGDLDDRVLEHMKQLSSLCVNAILEDGVIEKWEEVATLPLCELNQDSSNRAILDYAITANRFINALVSKLEYFESEGFV